MSLPVADVLAWDVANWSVALRFWERHGGIDGAPLDCLEIGANRGGISAWLAAKGHRVVCSDLEDCEASARPLVERYGVDSRVRFETIDATAIPYESHFDIVVFKSVLGGVGHNDAIARQRKAILAMHRALKPGGRLLFAENLAGSAVHRLLRRRFVRWGLGWRYVTIDEMRDFLQPFARVAFDTTGVLATFGRSETQRQLLAALDRAALSAAVPPDWRYIMYGVATK